MQDKSKAQELLKEALSVFYREQHKEAADIFLQALKLDPENPEILYHLGNAYYYLNDLSQALSYYQKAVSADEEEPHYHFVLGNTLLELRRFDEAASELEKAASLYLHLFIVKKYLLTKF